MNGFPRIFSLAFSVLPLAAVSTTLLVSPVAVAQDSPAAAKEITKAVNAYLKEQDSPLADKVNVTVDSHEGDTYRVLVIPNDPQASDLADAYLRKGADGWKVLGLGGGFDEAFYKENKIPEPLQDPIIPDVFLPAKAEVREKVREQLQKALGKELKVTESTPFTDVFSQDSGKATLLLLTGNEKEVGGAKSLHEKSTKAFAELGWKEDPAYVTPGPSGVTTMYRGPGNAFAYLSAVWDASPDSGLSEEDDASLANLKPEQKLYRVEWFLAEPAPGATLSAPQGEMQAAPATSLPAPDAAPAEAALPGE